MGRAFEFRKTRKLKRWSQMSKAFTRIGKDIVIAVKEGGADPQTNSKLRQVMQNAKTANMPKENVLRAIKNASDKDTKNYEEIIQQKIVNGNLEDIPLPRKENRIVFGHYKNILGQTVYKFYGEYKEVQSLE